MRFSGRVMGLRIVMGLGFVGLAGAVASCAEPYERFLGDYEVTENREGRGDGAASISCRGIELARIPDRYVAITYDDFWDEVLFGTCGSPGSCSTYSNVSFHAGEPGLTWHGYIPPVDGCRPGLCCDFSTRATAELDEDGDGDGDRLRVELRVWVRSSEIPEPECSDGFAARSDALRETDECYQAESWDAVRR